MFAVAESGQNRSLGTTGGGGGGGGVAMSSLGQRMQATIAGSHPLCIDHAQVHRQVPFTHRHHLHHP